MTDWGLAIKNSRSMLQIDNRYANLALSNSFALTISPSDTVAIANGVSRRGTKDVSVAGATPMLAFRGNVPVHILRVTPYSGGYTFTLGIRNGFNEEFSGTVYVFDKVSAASRKFSTDWGILVRRPDTGLVTFDSRYKYMRVIGVAETGGPGNTATYSTSATAAAMVCNPGRLVTEVVVTGTDGNGNQYSSYEYYVSILGAALSTAGSLTNAWTATGLGPVYSDSQATMANNNPGSIFIVDVAGY